MYSSRQLVTTSCLMDLKKYPFDVQECRLDVESFSHRHWPILQLIIRKIQIFFTNFFFQKPHKKLEVMNKHIRVGSREMRKKLWNSNKSVFIIKLKWLLMPFFHSDDELLYFYKEGNKTISFQELIDIPHFSLLGHKQAEKTATTATGTYKRLLITMYVKRDPQRYMHK